MAADRSRVWELDEVLALVGAARRPVGAFEYADTNYNLLGLVIEHVRKRPLVDVLRDGVLRVEGTERLIYQPDEAPTDPMAMPRGEPRTALEQGAGFLPSMSEVTPRSGVRHGVRFDLARPLVAGVLRWRNRFGGLADRDVDVLRLAQTITGSGCSIPWMGTRKAVGHLGANFGYISSAGCVTEDPLIFVVLTNHRTAHGADLAVPLVRAALSD